MDRPGENFANPAIKILESRRNRVKVEVAGSFSVNPVALAFPRPWFPGYQATLNGRPVPTRAYLGFIPIVELPPGSMGVVDLRYWPNFLRLGLPLAAGSTAILFMAALICRLPFKRKAP